MFRIPMRLENWIAFDGAGLAEFAADDGAAADESWGAADAASDDFPEEPGPGPAEFFFPAAAEFSGTNTLSLTFADFPEHSGAVSLTFPIGLGRPAESDPGLAAYLPFIHSGSISLSISPAAAADIQLQNLFVSIGFPPGGSFTLFSGSGGTAFSTFAAANGLTAGMLVAYSPDGIPDSGTSTGTIRVGTVVRYGDGTYGIGDSVHAARGLICGGSLRIGFLPGTTAEQAGTILNSLVCRPGGEPGGPFQVGIYHDAEGSPYSPGKLADGSGSAFSEEKSSGVIEDASRPCGPDGSLLGGDGGGGVTPPGPEDPDPEPPEQPDTDTGTGTEPPVTVLPPVTVTPPGTGDGAGASGGPPETAPEDSGGGTDGDGGAWGSSYADRSGWEEEEEARLPEDAAAGPPAAAETGGETEDGGETEAALPEVVFLREIELALSEIRAAHAALSAALNRLYAEYTAVHVSAWQQAARECIGSVMSSAADGRKDLAGLDASLSREMETLRGLPPARRDGMLQEAARELMEASARRTGSLLALAEAAGAVTAAMHAARAGGEAPPDGEALTAVFGDCLEAAEEKWALRHLRRDAMSRELEMHARLQEGDAAEE